MYFGVKKNYNLFKDLLINDIKNRYTGSILGIMWSVVHPLSSLLIYYFVFSVVLKMKLGTEYGDVNFTFWLMAGLLPWLIFSEVLIRSTSTVIDNSNIIKKTVFPSEILPVVIFFSSLFNHCVTIILFLIGLYFFNDSVIEINLFILPLYLLLLFLFTMGLSWLTSSLNVFLRDVGQLVGITVNIWFYMTPIIYPFNVVPEQLKRILVLNPIFPITEGYRMLFFKGQFIEINLLIIDLLVGVIVFLFGYLVFMKLKGSFTDVL